MRRKGTVRRRPPSQRVPPGCPLTPRQFEVLGLLADGLTGRELAEGLVVTRTTIRTHVAQALKRLDVATAPQAVAALARRGWLGWTPPQPPDPPLAGNPFLNAYLHELDAWLASRFSDERSRLGMRLALAGARNARRSP